MTRYFLVFALSVCLPFAVFAAGDVPQNQQQISLSFAPVVKQVTPSVVNIFTKRVVTRNVSPFANDPFFSQFFGGMGGGMGLQQKRLENSLGSGVIVNADGLAVTNAHVIRNADEITVALSDGREFPAKILVQDDASDLALLRIDTKGEKLPAAHLQSSEGLEVGDLVIAIGNPFGVGQTVTSGIISALARSSLDINDFNFFIQTDAAINPGNSGGPLVSMSGGVVGINSAIFSKSGGSLGIGFAIPSEMVTALLSAEKSGQISGTGTVLRPWVGVTAQNVTSDIAASMGLSSVSGALISAIHDESPAADAGLKTGDIVTSINGHMVKDASELRFRLATLALGDSATLSYQRGPKTGTATVKAVAPPDTPSRAALTLDGRTPLSGATLYTINPAVEAELDLKNVPSKGVVVAKIAATSIAQRLVQVGDIILEVNGTRVSTPQEVKSALKDGPTRQGWIIKVLSNGQTRTLMVR